jgi:type II secretory pathway component PulM
MAWFRKKADPISQRARALNAEIAALEAKIKKLDAHAQSQPRLRSTALPHGATVSHSTNGTRAAPAGHEPVFEDVDQDRLKTQAEAATTPQHYNELGVRKYDLVGFLQRFKNHFRGPSTANPKLVSYLAAGSIQGLRPLRYEKRVARNRLILLVTFLFLVLLGIICVFVRGR